MVLALQSLDLQGHPTAAIASTAAIAYDGTNHGQRAARLKPSRSGVSCSRSAATSASRSLLSQRSASLSGERSRPPRRSAKALAERNASARCEQMRARRPMERATEFVEGSCTGYND